MADYYAILTNTGKALEAEAVASGAKITLVKFVVGDGNGQVQIPDPARTTLVHEVYRNSISDLTVSAEQSNQMVAQLVMPANVGGFTVREIGLLTDKGELYAIANCATFDKPANGISITMQFRLAVSETDNVTLNVATGEGLFLRQDANLSDVKDKQKARQNLQLGTSATKDIGVASGNVMQVGAFGLGGVGIQITDADACDTNGFYSLKAGAHTGSPGGVASWEMLCIKYDSGSAKQLFWQAGSSTTKTWIRYRISPLGGWGPFQYYYSTENKPTAQDTGAIPVTDKGVYNGQVMTVNARYPSANNLSTAFMSNNTPNLSAAKDLNKPALEISNNGNKSAAAVMMLHREGEFATYFGLDSDNALAIGGYSISNTRWRIYHEGFTGDLSTQQYAKDRAYEGQSNAIAWADNNCARKPTALLQTTGWFRDATTGYITQWGIVNRGSGITRVWFPTAFPNACFNVQLTLRNSNSGGSESNVLANSEDAQGFNYISRDNEVQAFWEAKGK